MAEGSHSGLVRLLVTLRVIDRRSRKHNMFYTYLIKSKNKKWFYLGSTEDLKRRFTDHNRGRVKSTKFYAPFELFYYEAYSTYSLARKREVELKIKGQQKEILFKRLGLL